MLLASLIGAVGCAGGKNLEDGRAGLPERTAGWAAALALPSALDWQSDAGLSFVTTNDPVGAADGTAAYWYAVYVSSASVQEYWVKVADSLGEAYEAYPAYTGVPMSGWLLNSDEIIDIASSAVQFSEGEKLNVTIGSASSVFHGSGNDLGIPDDHPISGVIGEAAWCYVDATNGDILMTYR